MSDRRDLWIDGEHVVLTDAEYELIRDATGVSPKHLTVEHIDGLLEWLEDHRAEEIPETHPDAAELILSSFDELEHDERVEGQPTKPTDTRVGTPVEPVDRDDREDDVDEEEDVLEISPTEARDRTEYWVMVYNTGSQRKGLHLPAGESTYDDPVHRCDRPVDADADLVSKSISVFPFPAYEDRVCDNCLKDLADEIEERGDLRAD